MDKQESLKAIGTAIEDALSAIEGVEALAEQICEMAKVVAEVSADGGRVFLFGNGGSASAGEHIAGKLVTGMSTGETIHAEALTSSSVITAIADEVLFEDIFMLQILEVRPPLCCIGISTSGKSLNVLKALQWTALLGGSAYLLVGPEPERWDSWIEREVKTGEVVVLSVPCEARREKEERIHEAHLLIGHLFAREALAIKAGMSEERKHPDREVDPEKTLRLYGDDDGSEFDIEEKGPDVDDTSNE